MDKTLLKLLKEAKGMDKNRSKEQIFNAGFKAGVQCMMDKIEQQYQLGKPILANDHLYWLKGAKENLRDIMDDIEAEYNAEMEKNE